MSTATKKRDRREQQRAYYLNVARARRGIGESTNKPGRPRKYATDQERKDAQQHSVTIYYNKMHPFTQITKHIKALIVKHGITETADVRDRLLSTVERLMLEILSEQQTADH